MMGRQAAPLFCSSRIVNHSAPRCQDSADSMGEAQATVAGPDASSAHSVERRFTSRTLSSRKSFSTSAPGTQRADAYTCVSIRADCGRWRLVRKVRIDHGDKPQ